MCSFGVPRVRIPPSPLFFPLEKITENRKSTFDNGEKEIFDSVKFRLSNFKKMAFIFEKLDVYRKSVDFAEEICELTKSFTKGNYYLADQINRASLSIPLNIAEGNGRYHKADKINFFRIARGSAFECVPILEICKRKKLITDNRNKELKEEIEDICKMLSGLINR